MPEEVPLKDFTEISSPDASASRAPNRGSGHLHL
jgi:hypothetical protein